MMRRPTGMGVLIGLCLVVGGSDAAFAEEIQLKDGTKVRLSKKTKEAV